MLGSIAAVVALAVGFWFSVQARKQSQHALLRNFPLLGRMRYVLEHLGPELRQYLFDGDRTGKPFSRDDYVSMIMASKYLNTLVSFGSKRDYEESGWYLRNAMLPSLKEEMGIDAEPAIETQRYTPRPRRHLPPPRTHREGQGRALDAERRLRAADRRRPAAPLGAERPDRNGWHVLRGPRPHRDRGPELRTLDGRCHLDEHRGGGAIAAPSEGRRRHRRPDRPRASRRADRRR